MKTDLVVQRQRDEVILISWKKEFSSHGGDGDGDGCSALASLALLWFYSQPQKFYSSPKLGMRGDLSSKMGSAGKFNELTHSHFTYP